MTPDSQVGKTIGLRLLAVKDTALVRRTMFQDWIRLDGSIVIGGTCLKATRRSLRAVRTQERDTLIGGRWTTVKRDTQRGRNLTARANPKYKSHRFAAAPSILTLLQRLVMYQ